MVPEPGLSGSQLSSAMRCLVFRNLPFSPSQEECQHNRTTGFKGHLSRKVLPRIPRTSPENYSDLMSLDHMVTLEPIGVAELKCSRGWYKPLGLPSYRFLSIIKQRPHVFTLHQESQII